MANPYWNFQSDSVVSCSKCKHMKCRPIGDVSAVFWCGLVGDGYNGTSIGIRPWLGTVHPKCPIKHPELYEKAQNGKLREKKGADK